MGPGASVPRVFPGAVAVLTVAIDRKGRHRGRVLPSLRASAQRYVGIQVTLIFLHMLFHPAGPTVSQKSRVCPYGTEGQKAQLSSIKASLKGLYEEPHGICNLITKLVPLRT